MSTTRQLLNTVSLVQRLRAGPPMTLVEVADFLGRGERTARRALQDLRELDVPLVESTDEGCRGRKVYRVDPNWAFLPVGLDGIDALVLRLLIARAEAGLRPGLGAELDQLVHKLRLGFAPLGEGAWDALTDVVASTPRGATSEDVETLEEIIDAARWKHVCRCRYRTARGVEHDYAIEPLRVVAHDGKLYVILRLRPGGEWRSLVIGRFVSLERTREHFEPPSAADLEAFMASPFGVFHDEPFRALVRVDPAYATYVAERRWHPSQRIERRPDGSLDIRFDAEGRPEVLAWVMRLGRHAELLEPSDLREELVRELDATRARYRASPPLEAGRTLAGDEHEPIR